MEEPEHDARVVFEEPETGAKPEPEPEAEPQPEEPLTAERIAEMSTEFQLSNQLGLWGQLANQAHAQLAQAVLLLRLHPGGGVEAHPEQLRKQARIARAHIGELERIRVELEEGSPLPEPPDLVVAQALPASRKARRGPGGAAG